MFNPWFKRGVTRTHRKMCVVDQSQAFVGGININDDMFCDHDGTLSLAAPRWDFAVQVHGPLVATIHMEMQSAVARLGKMGLIKRIGCTATCARCRSRPPSTWCRPAFVVRDNLRNRRTIQRAYLQALGQARRACCWPIRISRRAASSAARWPPPPSAA
jgi:cardiolipin synthase